MYIYICIYIYICVIYIFIYIYIHIQFYTVLYIKCPWIQIKSLRIYVLLLVYQRVYTSPKARPTAAVAVRAPPRSQPRVLRVRILMVVTRAMILGIKKHDEKLKSNLQVAIRCTFGIWICTWATRRINSL